jgi:hypothetical protein
MLIYFGVTHMRIMNFLRKKVKKNEAATLNVETNQTVQDSLLNLCKGDKRMYDVMNHFLLVRPEEQIRQLGTTEELTQKAAEALRSNSTSSARIFLEFAAKAEMYRGDAEKARALLEKAVSLHDECAEEREHILLSKLQKAMLIAKQYYHQYGPLDIQEQEEPLLVKA